MKHTTQYLFNLDASTLAAIPYREALEHKIESGKALFDDIYLDTPFNDRDEERVDAVYKALKHTRALLDELDGSHP